ncbi:hypothetical protein SE17_06240 [Kouleothrix aurantiaca]|uniref:Uncharacterized protein n=1 Tax=Kouleothrix aurantiaca TaxID=186479 RepID=A0A0P9DKJ0_9CHLR|nr:hypothetical protein SE17_06240 [Kouleothrix aurantiaca]
MVFTAERTSNSVDVNHHSVVGVSHQMIGSYQNYNNGIVVTFPGGLSNKYINHSQTSNSAFESHTISCRRTSACSPTPLRGPKIVPFLKLEIEPKVISIYRCGAADA